MCKKHNHANVKGTNVLEQVEYYNYYLKDEIKRTFFFFFLQDQGKNIYIPVFMLKFRFTEGLIPP